MLNEFVEWLLTHGWVDGHMPEGQHGERVKYRREDGEWQHFHKPQISEEELRRKMADYQREVEEAYPWERGGR